MNQMQTSDDQNKENQLDPKPLEDLLERSPLKYLVMKARQILAADETLYRLLPAELASHCRTMNVTTSTVIIEVDSAVWGTRLRYIVPELLEELQQDPRFNQVTDIYCRVRPMQASGVSGGRNKREG